MHKRTPLGLVFALVACAGEDPTANDYTEWSCECLSYSFDAEGSPEETTVTRALCTEVDPTTHFSNPAHGCYECSDTGKACVVAGDPRWMCECMAYTHHCAQPSDCKPPESWTPPLWIEGSCAADEDVAVRRVSDACVELGHFASCECECTDVGSKC